MTTYEEIKHHLMTGFMVLVELTKEQDGGYAYFSSIEKDGCLRATYFMGTKEDAYDSLGINSRHEKEINELEIKSITPIPHIYKEIPKEQKVRIIDCPELREFAKRDNWNERQKEMIGQSDFEIDVYFNDFFGQSYRILEKDKEDWYRFPAWAICADIEEENDESVEEGKEKDTLVLYGQIHDVLEKLEERIRNSEKKIHDLEK